MNELEELLQLLKHATQFKKDKNLTSAIASLRSARIIALKESSLQTKNIDLKLALYLQENGEAKEAEGILVQLYKKYISKSMELPEILDKIRIFYERNSEIEKSALFLTTEALAFELNQYIQWLRYEISSFENFNQVEEKYIKNNTKDHHFIGKLSKLEKKYKLNLNVQALEEIFQINFKNFVNSIPMKIKEKSTSKYIFQKAKENFGKESQDNSSSDFLDELFSKMIQTTVENCESVLASQR
ncbi:hypothetical protein AB3N59_14995 [Leptospira sp. WS92.C1]